MGIVGTIFEQHYAEKRGLNIVHVDAQAWQPLGDHRQVTLPAAELNRCRGTADLIIGRLSGSSLESAWRALGPQGELVLTQCDWRGQDREVKAALLRRFDYVKQHQFEERSQSVVVLRKRNG